MKQKKKCEYQGREKIAIDSDGCNRFFFDS